EIVELLPGDEMRATVEIDGVHPTARSTVEVVLEPAAVGATGLDLAPVTATAHSWSIPWFWLGILVLVALATWFARRHRRRRARQTAAALAAARAEGRAEGQAQARSRPEPDPPDDQRADEGLDESTGD